MASASSVAREFVALSYAGDEPDPLTNLRLQKLLYYAQAWSFVVRGANLFPEAVQAWRHGPVVRRVYAAVPKGVKADVLGRKQFADAAPLTAEQSAFVRAVWETYREFSATKLAALTHDEDPWLDAWGDRPEGGTGSEVIPPESMADYFAKQPVPTRIAAHR
ncbi:MAG: Panacea domain-containing protein [Gemmataceae bacterium]